MRIKERKVVSKLNDEFYRWFNRQVYIKINNKERAGYRGKKQRYAVFRAEYNQKWLNNEEKVFKQECDRHNLEYDQFIDVKANPNCKWREALYNFRIWEINRMIDKELPRSEYCLVRRYKKSKRCKK